MSSETVLSAANARRRVMQRQRALDPTTYSVAVKKRWDAKFGLAGLGNEIVANAELDAVGRRVRVKNTSGGAYAKGSLVGLAGALTIQPSATASNSPAAGTGVTINVAGSDWQVGQEVTIVSGGYTDYAIITAIGSGYIVVDFVFYDHTGPVVTALPAYEISLADADAAAPAEWVLPAAIAAGEYGWAFDCCEVTGLDTSAFSAEVLLYLSATAGTYTNTAPTGSDQIQQVVGIVKSSHASTGAILFIPGLKRIVKYGSSFLQSGLAVTDGDKGDITVSSSGTVWTIDAGVVTLAKMANIATDRLIGRDTAGTGVPEAIALANGLEFTGATSIGIADDGVTNARLNNMAALTVKVNATNATADPSDLAFAADGDMLMRIGTTLTTGNFSSLTAIDIALDDAIPLSDTSASAANKKVAVDRLLGAGAKVCDGRLTLTSGTAVTSSDVTASTNVYLTPYNGNSVALYDGTRWKIYTLTEVTLALGTISARTTQSFTTTSGATGLTGGNTTGIVVGDLITGTGIPAGSYVTKIHSGTELKINNPATSSATNTMSFYTSTHDIFLYDNAGTLTLEKLAWSNSATRATAIALQNGVLVKNGDATRRLVGTILFTSTTQTADSDQNRCVCSVDNPVPRTIKLQAPASSHSYSTAAWQEWGGPTNTAAVCRFAVSYEQMSATFAVEGNIDPSADGVAGYIAAGLNTFNGAGMPSTGIETSQVFYGSAFAFSTPVLGCNVIVALEYASASSVTFGSAIVRGQAMC